MLCNGVIIVPHFKCQLFLRNLREVLVRPRMVADLMTAVGELFGFSPCESAWVIPLLNKCSANPESPAETVCFKMRGNKSKMLFQAVVECETDGGFLAVTIAGDTDFLHADTRLEYKKDSNGCRVNLVHRDCLS